VAARSALDLDRRALDHHLQLRQLAVGAENEALDELVEDLAEVGGLVAAVDDGPLRRNVELALRAELDSEELGGVRGVNVQSLGDVDLQDKRGMQKQRHPASEQPLRAKTDREATGRTSSHRCCCVCVHTMLVMTVLIPLPRPSTLVVSTGI
jgi:hypothetical protein